MIEVEPEVFCIFEPAVNTEDIKRYLYKVGGEKWFHKIFDQDSTPPAAQTLVEFMGRLCYKSWTPGLNKNVTKIREDSDDYLLNILRQKHGSVLEHANFTFVINNGSRVFTAEMNRHRAGTAISEQSLRYVRLDKDLPFRLPHGVLRPETVELGRLLVSQIEGVIEEMYRLEEIDAEGASFHQKKMQTSAIRRFAPMGMGTEEGWTANIRSIRHVISMRSSAGAEEEIRIIADQIAKIMCEKCPALFADYHQLDVEGSPVPAWEADFLKV